MPASPLETASPSRWVAGSILAVLVAAHGWLTFRLFPSGNALVNDDPVISVDHAIHLYHGYLGARFLKDHGTSWGYDPFFMAGYPKTPVYDSSSGPAELFQLLAGGAYSPRAYKIGITILVALVPIVVGLASWLYGARLAAVAATVAWTEWYWWVGFPDILVRTGLVAFVCSSTVAVLLPALFVRWAQRPNTTHWVALAGAAAVGIQAHSIFPLLVFGPLAVGYAQYVARRSSGVAEAGRCRPLLWHVATWAALAGALAATSFWWVPLVRFLPLKTSSELFMTYQGPALELLRRYYLIYDGRVPLLMVMYGTVGIACWWLSGRRREVATMVGIQIVVFTLLTFCGSVWRVTRNLEPLRFQVPLGLAWAVVAGEGLCAVLAALDPRLWRGSGWARLRWCTAALFLALSLLLTFPARLQRSGYPLEQKQPSSWAYSRWRFEAARPLAVGLRPEMQELASWIRTNTDSSARILLEDQLRLLENLDPGLPESMHWTPLLPLLTGREFVGGLYHLAFIPHQRAAFGDWKLAEKNIREWSPDELRRFCDRYNIGWVITWSRASLLKPGAERGQPLSTDVFATLPFCTAIARIPRHTTRPDENEYTIFRVDREMNFFARGRGRVVQADYNRIELADLVPESGELVLRYHWQQGFRAEPPVTVEQAYEPGDPVGFIRIKSPRSVPQLVLTNDYR